MEIHFPPHSCNVSSKTEKKKKNTHSRQRVKCAFLGSDWIESIHRFACAHSHCQIKRGAERHYSHCIHTRRQVGLCGVLHSGHEICGLLIAPGLLGCRACNVMPKYYKTHMHIYMQSYQLSHERGLSSEPLEFRDQFRGVQLDCAAGCIECTARKYPNTKLVLLIYNI